MPHGINNTNMPKKTIETTRVYLVKSKEKKEKISSEASPLGGGGGGVRGLGGFQHIRRYPLRLQA